MRAQAKDGFVSFGGSTDDEAASASGSESGSESESASSSSSSGRHLAPEDAEEDYASDWTDDLTSDAHLNALLVKARISMDKLAKRASKSKKHPGKGKSKAADIDSSDEEEDEDADEDRDGELDFMVFEEEKEDNIKLPPLLADGLPPLYVEWKDGALSVRNLDAEDVLKSLDGLRKTQPAESTSVPANAVDSSDDEDEEESDDKPAASGSKITLDIAAPAPPAATYETDSKGRRITKKEKKERKAETAGALWYDLPQATPEAQRAAEAIRLRNSLNPKQFYRKEGDGKSQQKYMAIGKIVASSSPFGQKSADNLPKAARKRTIVDELVDDAEAKRYAKKKFTELSANRSARGRGTLKRRQEARRGKW